MGVIVYCLLVPACPCLSLLWCSQFCTCQNFKTLAIQNCPSGLLFNREVSACDWPQNVKCI